MALYQTKCVCVLLSNYEASARTWLVIILCTPMYLMNVCELDVIVNGDR